MKTLAVVLGLAFGISAFAGEKPNLRCTDEAGKVVFNYIDGAITYYTGPHAWRGYMSKTGTLGLSGDSGNERFHIEGTNPEYDWAIEVYADIAKKTVILHEDLDGESKSTTLRCAELILE